MSTFEETAKTITWGTLILKDAILIAQSCDYLKDKDLSLGVVHGYSPNEYPDSDPWRFFSYPDETLTSCCLWSHTDSGIDFRCVLSEEGMVNLYGPGGKPDRTFQIPEAGVFGKAAAGYGYVQRIRSIGESLYVCGSHRQVYEYIHSTNNPLSGRFQNMAGNMRQSPLPKPPPLKSPDYQKWLDIKLVNFNDLAGHSESDIYVTGDETWHFNGQTWRQLSLPNDDETMHVIKVIDTNTVLIGGANGYLLVGNAQTGFRNISSVDDNQTITGLEMFNGTLYIASDSGLFTYNSQSKRIEPYRTNLKVDLVDAHLLEAKDGILWSFGYKDLAYFDGKTWVRLHNPENQKVDAPQPKKARPAPDEPSEADLAAIAAAQREALSWLPSAPRKGASAGTANSLDLGGLLARVGHIGIGQFVLDQLQASGLKPAQILQTKKGERYTVNIPQQGVSLVLQYAPEQAADTAANAPDKHSPKNWALAEVLTQTQYADASSHWQGAWLGKLNPNGNNILEHARTLWDEEQASTATQASFFVDAPHGAAWVINLEWMSPQGRLKHIKVLNLGGYLPWQENTAG
jgi:hypothetical protein